MNETTEPTEPQPEPEEPTEPEEGEKYDGGEIPPNGETTGEE
jgi:hypothetical protein